MGDNLEIFGLKLDSGADHVRAQGLLALNSLTADLEGQVKLDGLRPVLHLKIPLDGQVDARWELKGLSRTPMSTPTSRTATPIRAVSHERSGYGSNTRTGAQFTS